MHNFMKQMDNTEKHHGITPDLKFETLLQESDLRPSQREKFMNAVTAILKAKNLDYSDIRLKDIVNIFDGDLRHTELSPLQASRFEEFLSQNGFKVKGGREDDFNISGKDDGRFVMRDYPEIIGSNLYVRDIQEQAAAAARTERIKNITLDTPLDKFLDDADIKLNRKMYYEKVTEALNRWGNFPRGPIKDLSEVNLRVLEDIPIELVFHKWAGYMHKNYLAVRDLLHEAGAGIGTVTISYTDGSKKDVEGIKVIGKFPESRSQEPVRYEDELSDEVENRIDTRHIVSNERLLDTVHRYIMTKIADAPAKAFAARISNPSQKSFSQDQKEAIGKYIDTCRSTDISDRESYSFLVRQGKMHLEHSVSDKWVDDAASELKDIYNGVERQMANQVKR